MSEIVIDWLGGNCPVQAEGTIDGKEFYFRARGSHWALEIEPRKYPAVEWRYKEEWGEGPYDAGWMPEDVAREMINKAAANWRLQRSPS